MQVARNTPFHSWLPLSKAGEQIGVQGDDISHRHERGQAGQDFGLYVCTVFLQLKIFSIVFLLLKNSCGINTH